MSTRPAPAAFAGVVPDAGRRLRTSGEEPAETLPGVGPRVAERLARLGIATVRDLAEHLPRAYLDWDEVAGFGDLAAGEEGTVRCTLERVRVRPTRRRNLKLVEGVVVDRAGVRESAVWFNQAHLAKLPAGTELLLHGTRELSGGFRVARTEIGGAGVHTVGLVPEYPASEDMPSYRLRALVGHVLPRLRLLPDPLPARLRAEERLPLRRDALAAAHRPRERAQAEEARQRLALEELLVLQLGVLRRRRAHEAQASAPALGADGELVARYRALLPFELTEEQEQAIREIGRDLAGERPMQRLLQGDVGSGKTVVALYALLRAVEAGHQGALMAPTETLAEQHFLTVEGICTDLGVRCELLTSSLPAAQRRAARERLASGEADLGVGTHALIQAEVEFRSLAVAVVDEQHRFGVEQRRALGRSTPHVLHMTATPIPRTLAQTVYGDLDVTEIARPPASRRPVVTRWVGHERSSEAYTRLRRHLEEGRQAYVVCPLVSESEVVEARAAEQEAERLRAAELRGLRVGCLHGKLPAAERRAVMDAFKRRELDVLVATTVIEVGVDVPNATIMIVQEADRFGLAQLHQLRGRVGRGAEQSYCLLVSRPKEELTEDAGRRLEALVEIADGFRLAEVDLALRGEGQLRGTRQSGWSDLKFARLAGDRRLIARARTWAERLIDEDEALVDPLGREAERVEDHRGFA
ncbi:MAG TPA: ATP-dependent DNA helicase RecG [Gaiellaceae bacterium]|nr:ATP-dependent DNA helicase RecG [Gaiellaceae bacterium]